jgi:hypothetical protein
MSDRRKHVIIDYTNWRGERSERLISPMYLTFTNNKWHPSSQWMVQAVDVKLGEHRTFPLANIHAWRPA